MSRFNSQAPSSVIMIRPHHFEANPQTVKDNSFQSNQSSLSSEEIKRKAHAEVTIAAQAIESHGINVHLFEDTSKNTPDSVFPNNWFSTHPGGHVAVYPMFAPNRRRERREDILYFLKKHYRVQNIVDYSGLEYDDIFLEGTGAMVLDHFERVAYTCRSNRANALVLERFCAHFGYEPMFFTAVDNRGIEIYHTNVFMCIATDFVLAGTNMIKNEGRRDEVIKRLELSGREVIHLSDEQVAQFAGNALELSGNDRRILALSTTAKSALTQSQIAVIERSATLVPIDVRTIEMAGGSVRCMMAGIHLSPRN